MRHGKLPFVVILAVLLLVPVAGCASIGKKAVEKATGVRVDEDGQKVTVTDKDGSTSELSAQEGKYPDGFPDDFPKYEGAKVDSALKAAKDGKDSFTVIITTPDSATEVYDWYAKEVASEGWEIESQLNGTSDDSAYGTITVVKGELRGGVSITRGSDDTVTSVMIGLSPKE